MKQTSEVKNLDSLLEYLVTEEGRSSVVYQAVRGHHPVRPENIERAIRFYEGKNKFEQAAQLAEAKKDIKMAILFYKKASKFERAATWYKELGDLEGAIKFYEKAAEKELSERRRMAKKHKDSKTSEYLVKNAESLLTEAATLAEKMGDFKRAVKLYERAGNYGYLINNADKFNLDQEKKREYYKKAMQKYEEMEKFKDAIDLARATGDITWANRIRKKAIRLKSKSKHDWDLGVAAELANEMGDKKKANALYDKAMHHAELQGFFSTAAMYAERKGDLERKEAYRAIHQLLNPEEDYGD